MPTTLVPRAPSVLTRAANEQPRRLVANAVPTVGRSYQVLQSSRDPAQLNLFLRPGATDFK